MITSTIFQCPQCKKSDHQKIIFLGSEFSYVCENCGASHCFLENAFWDFTDNFKEHGCGTYKWRLNRYAGTLHNGQWYGEYLMNSFRKNDYTNSCLFNSRYFFNEIINLLSVNKKNNSIKNQTIKLSNKSHSNKKIYIANAISTSHFQDCLRAVVRMKEHLVGDESNDTYNILIMDCKTKFLLKPINKMNGLDEIWYIDWSHKCSWDYGMKHLNDLTDNLSLSISINSKLNQYSNIAKSISKCGFPSKYGVEPIKELFCCSRPRDNNKYVAILIHDDNEHRSGFRYGKQITDVYNLILESGRNPIVVACTNHETSIAKSIRDIKYVSLTTLHKQSKFYKYNCVGVVGSNCSGCNIPCLFGVPLFTLAKTRCFPDDFYSMGRLLTKYDCNEGFFGRLNKPETVTELKIDQSKPTNIFDVKKDFIKWLNKVVQK